MRKFLLIFVLLLLLAVIGNAWAQPAAYTFTSLSMGSTGAAVSILQDKLGMKPADGIFGKKTKKAVIQFQKDSDIAPTGIVDKKTLAALNNEVSQDEENSVDGTPVPPDVVQSPTVVPTIPMATKTPVTKPTKESDIEWQLGMEGKSFPVVNTGTLAPGFEYNPSSSLEPEIFLQAKGKKGVLKNASLELSADLGGQNIGLGSYGSSFNSIHVSTVGTIASKYYIPIAAANDVPLSAVIGIGFNLIKVAGQYEMGGVRWETDYNDLNPVVPIGVEFGGDVRFRLMYEFQMVDLVTKVPGVGSEEFEMNGDLVFGIGFTF